MHNVTRPPKIRLKMKPEISRVVSDKNQWRTSTDEAVVVKYPPISPKYCIASKNNVCRPRTSIVS
jgi:hypothetical protein